MRSATRLDWFTVAAVLLLLFITAFSRPELLLVLSVLVLAAGLIWLPHMRTRGSLAAVIAAAAAVFIAAARESERSVSFGSAREAADRR